MFEPGLHSGVDKKLRVSCRGVAVGVFAAVTPLLQKHNIKLVFINTAIFAQSEIYLARYEEYAPFPGTLLLDSKKATHHHFGFQYGIFRSLIPPILLGVPKYGIYGAIRGAILGFKNFSLAGSSWQQGGTAVVLKNGSITFINQEQHPADFAPLEQVLHSAGVPKNEIPINIEPSNELLKFLNSKRKKNTTTPIITTPSQVICENGTCRRVKNEI